MVANKIFVPRFLGLSPTHPPKIYLFLGLRESRIGYAKRGANNFTRNSLNFEQINGEEFSL